MDYYKLWLLIKDQTGSDDEITDWANAPSIEHRDPYYISYRSVLAVIADPVRLEAIAAVLKANYPTTHEIMLQVGDTNGSAGGLSLGSEATRIFIQSLATPQGGSLLTQDEANSLCALGVRMVSPAENAGLDRVHPGYVHDSKIMAAEEGR